MSAADWAGRYDTSLGKTFSDESKLQFQLKVELAALKALGAIGKVPKEAYEALSKSVSEGKVTLARVRELEALTQHDVMAMVKALTECSEEYGGYVHFGLTSQDINDTVLALQMTEAKSVLLQSVAAVKNHLRSLSEKYKDTACIARTHGQHAIPTTLGFKFANFLYELSIAEEYLLRCKTNVGKLAGAVGTFASLGTDEVQSLVMADLGLQPPLICTQVVSRLFIADFIFACSAIASALERLAKEIRNMQRSEIFELCEGVLATQVGSSTMPQKRNPHKSERVCGIARLIRSQLHPALETIPLEHERDLTNSSVERVTVPAAAVLTHYILLEMAKILANLGVDEEHVSRNLHLGGGSQMAERVMMVLAAKIGRQEAHEVLRTHVQKDQSSHGIHSIRDDLRVREVLTEEELDELLAPETYIGLAPQIVDKVIAGTQ